MCRPSSGCRRRFEPPHLLPLGLTLILLPGCGSLPAMSASLMEGLQSLAQVAGGHAEFGAGFGGSFEGTVDGVPASLELSQSGPWIEGRARIDQVEYRLGGTVQNGRARGHMIETKSFQTSSFEVEVHGADLALVIVDARPEAEARRFSFRRSGAPADPILPDPQDAVVVVEAGASEAEARGHEASLDGDDGD